MEKHCQLVHSSLDHSVFGKQGQICSESNSRPLPADGLVYSPKYVAFLKQNNSGYNY